MGYSIYKITNLVNGKLYIGKTINSNNRWKTHLSITKSGPTNRRYQYLHRAINKYGSDNFKFEVIESGISEQDIIDRERYYIAKYDTFHGEGYNLSEIASKRIGTKNSFYGKKHSDNAKALMSKNGYRKRRYFSFEKAEEIRKTYYNTKSPYKELAKLYNTNHSMIEIVITFVRAYAEDASISLWPIKDNRAINSGRRK